MSQNIEVAPLEKAPDSWTAWIRAPFVILSKNPKILFASLAGILLLVAGALFFQSQSASKSEEAEVALFDAKLQLARAIDGAKSKSDEKNENSESENQTRFSWDTVESYATSEKRPDISGAVNAFDVLIKNYPNTPAAFDAAYLLGRIAQIDGDHTRAKELFEKALGAAPDRFAKASSLLALAASLEDLKELERAQEKFADALSAGVVALRGEALMGLARVATSRGLESEARGYFEQILKELPDSAYADRVQAIRPDLKAAAPETEGEKL